MGRKFREVVVADHVHFVSIVTHQIAKAFETRQTLRIIFSPLSGNGRDRVIVCCQFCPQVVGIPNVEQPPISLLYRHTAMTESVAEQRDQQHFG